MESAIYIGAFAVAGTVSRCALETFFENGKPSNLTKVNPVMVSSFVANVVGCLIMGVLSQSTPSKSRRGLSKFYTFSIHKGLMTGYCGSLTTFAGFTLSSNKILVSKDPEPVAWIFSILLTFCGSFIAFIVGRDIPDLCSRKVSPTKDDLVELSNIKRPEEELSNIQRPEERYIKEEDKSQEPKLHKKASQLILNISNIENKTHVAYIDKPDGVNRIYTVIISIAVVLISAALSVLVTYWQGVEQRDGLWFAVLLSPLGALMRYWLGGQHNPKKELRSYKEYFPMGTFIANQTAVVVLCLVVMIHDITYSSESQKHRGPYVVGIAQGFCATLSTVSSLIMETWEIREDSENQNNTRLGREAPIPTDYAVIPNVVDDNQMLRLSYVYILGTIFLGQLLASIFSAVVVSKN